MGRVILGDAMEGSSSRQAWTQAGIAIEGAAASPLADNPFLASCGSSFSPLMLLEVPGAEGLEGGPEGFGLLPSWIVQQDPLLVRAAAENVGGAPLAVVRVEQGVAGMHAPYAMAIDDQHEMPYDMIVLVNLTNEPLHDVTFNGMSLKTRGVLRGTVFGGEGTVRELPSIEQGRAWATLVPRACEQWSVGVGSKQFSMTLVNGDIVHVAWCPADFNMDGGVDGTDVDAFFWSWEAGEADADVNADGGVDGGDVDRFFVLWEGGGC